MRIFTFIIIVFSIFGTIWSMWLRSEIKDEEAKLKNIEKKISLLDYKLELANVEWSYVTQSKNIEEINNKFLKLEPIPIVDIKSYRKNDIVVSKVEEWVFKRIFKEEGSVIATLIKLEKKYVH